jgi:hypothetical protein
LKEIEALNFRYEEVLAKLALLEKMLNDNPNAVHIQTIANSIGLFGKVEAVLDESLPFSMNKSVNTVNDKLDQLLSEIEKLKRELEESQKREKDLQREIGMLRIQGSKKLAKSDRAVSSEGKIKKESKVLQLVSQKVIEINTPLVDSSKKKKTGKHEDKNRKGSQSQIEFDPAILEGMAKIDLTKLSPCDPVNVHWRDEPKLPVISQFQTLDDVVNFVYKSYPYFEAYIKTFHDGLRSMMKTFIIAPRKTQLKRFSKGSKM